MNRYCMDSDGHRTYAGDTILFSYGIPPVRVTAEIVNRNGKLVALTPGHSPSSCTLSRLKSCVGEWWKIKSART